MYLRQRPVHGELLVSPDLLHFGTSRSYHDVPTTCLDASSFVETSCSTSAPLIDDASQLFENSVVSIVRNQRHRSQIIYYQSNTSFPSWTSRVRSPSPAFRFIDLRTYRFRKYSKYSVKGMMLGISALFRASPHLQTKLLVGALRRVFVTASLGS